MLSSRRARQLFSVHRWTGLLTGVVVLFLSLTGTGLVFITEIDTALNRDILTSRNTGPIIPPERAIAAVKAVFPKSNVGSLILPRDEGGVYVATTNKLKVNGQEFNEVSVDPHTGIVLGQRDRSKSFAFILRQMHLRFFYFGWKGRVVIGVFGLVLLFSTISGLLIYSRFIRALPSWYSIRRARGFQISTSDWHKLIGITALAFNIVISFTGMILGLENLARYSRRVSQAMHPTPEKGSVPKPPGTAQLISVSDALAAARAAIPGFEPTQINLANKKRHYMVLGNLRGKIAMEGASEVGIDAVSGGAYFVSSARTAPRVTRAYYWMDPLHFGYWGGVFSRILYVFFGLTTGFLSVSGFIVWYMKTRRRPRVRSIEMIKAAA
jgi:uncharacterized iron-regulated membrane protein